jgi:hypothetical protein
VVGDHAIPGMGFGLTCWQVEEFTCNLKRGKPPETPNAPFEQLIEKARGGSAGPGFEPGRAGQRGGVECMRDPSDTLRHGLPRRKCGENQTHLHSLDKTRKHSSIHPQDHAYHHLYTIARMRGAPVDTIPCISGSCHTLTAT